MEGGEEERENVERLLLGRKMQKGDYFLLFNSICH